jgi:hypothetical protein
MDEITLGASVAEQLQDLVISSQDVNGFLAELCVLSASALSRTLGQEVSCAVTLNRHHRTTTAAWGDSRWPEYCHAIASLGQLSVLGVPLTLDSGATAALNVFSPTADVFDDAAARKAEMFASQAEKALRLAVRIGVQQQLAADLRSAMESRTAIDPAAGIILGQNRCSQAEAMSILTKASSSRNQKLRLVAEKLVESFVPEAPATHFDG